DRVVPQFGGVQDIPGHPVNIDFLHSKDGRGGDRWFPHTYQTWHGKRFLCGDAAHGDVRMTQVPGEASQRVPTAHVPLLRVDDVPDNRRPERRMRVGTRTTARDWQWVNQAMEEDGEVEGSPQGALGRSSSQAQGRTHVDLNRPASDPFVDSSFALGGTPPSAFVDGPSHMDADDQAPSAAEDPEPRRGRRAVRRRGCGTGGHV
ncbi:hypothetical protein PIB30_100971, partial [Stylosanthes scabra]|nr:hypothetical protein [Stylosanthes scabra]